jgi:hypothetical protein
VGHDSLPMIALLPTICIICHMLLLQCPVSVASPRQTGRGVGQWGMSGTLPGPATRRDVAMTAASKGPSGASTHVRTTSILYVLHKST